MIVPFPMAFFTLATPAADSREGSTAGPALLSEKGASAPTLKGRAGVLPAPLHAEGSAGLTITDADILLGLVGRPLPWWRLIGW